MSVMRSYALTLLLSQPASSLHVASLAPLRASHACHSAAAAPPPRHAATRCAADKVAGGETDETEVDEEWRREQVQLRAAAEQWLAMSVAIKLSEAGGLQPFSVPAGWMAMPSPPPSQAYTEEELVAEVERREPSLSALLDACADRAPSLCSRATLLPLARLAAWTSDGWVRPLEEWAGEDEATRSREVDGERQRAALRGLAAHLLETWEVPPALHGALEYRDGPPTSEASHRVAKAFLAVHAAAGRGDASVLNTLRQEVSPTISKAAAKAFVKASAGSADADNDEATQDDSPLLALRRAQVASLGGPEWVGDAACASKLGSALQQRGGDEPSEEFAVVALDWACRNEESFGETPAQLTAQLDFFLEMRRIDSNYTCVGRTPKTAGQALEAYVASTVSFEEDDEAFQPNPRGLRGWFELGATVPAGTRLRVPYDGAYELGAPGEPESRPAVVRIAEILSLRRLYYEGQQLDNCLEGSRRSQGKYLSRARARVSSFWSLTRQHEGEPVKHLCLIEVWHTAYGNEIRQAEGPHPRTIPSPEAWYWLQRWCEREEVDLSTWDCYS